MRVNDLNPCAGSLFSSLPSQELDRIESASEVRIAAEKLIEIALSVCRDSDNRSRLKDTRPTAQSVYADRCTYFDTIKRVSRMDLALDFRFRQETPDGDAAGDSVYRQYNGAHAGMKGFHSRHSTRFVGLRSEMTCPQLQP